MKILFCSKMQDKLIKQKYNKIILFSNRKNNDINQF